jgi:SHS2 domain-containing protein
MAGKEKYKFLENFVTADMAFEAYGKDLSELFTNAASAVAAAMVEPKSMSPKIKKVIKMQNKDLPNLMIDFLNEIIYYKDAESLLFPKVKVKITEKNGLYHLAADLAGDKIDFTKHKVEADVKSATWHSFELQKKGKSWHTRVVLDI